RLPIKGKPTTYLLPASCLLTFSDNSEASFFCTTQLLKVNFAFRSFLSSISQYRVTLAYYTVCEAKKNVNLKKKKKVALISRKKKKRRKKGFLLRPLITRESHTP